MRPSVEPRLALYRDAVHRALFKAHIIKVSDEDLLHLGRVSWRADEQDLVMASKALFDDCPQAQLVALTLGAKGAYLITRQKTWRAWPRTDLIIADTVGAGDCFIAALNASLWQAGYLSGDRLVASNDVLINALKHAIAGASIDVTRVGCNPGNWQEVSSCAENITIDAT
jgi:fructokinase